MAKRTGNNYESTGGRKRSRLGPGSGSRSYSQNITPHTSASGTSVYVGNLAYETSWQNLKDHMRRAGNVDNAKVMSSENGRSKGCGIVVYQNPKEAARAIRELNDTMLDGRKIFVRADREAGSGGGGGNGGNDARGGRGGGGGGNSSSSSNDANCQLYVGNIPYETKWYELKDYFKSAGIVDHAEIIEGNDGRKKGFGIVKFANAKDAQNAIRRLDGTEFQGRPIDVRLDRRSSDFDGDRNSNNNNRNNNDNDNNSTLHRPRNTEKARQLFVGNLSFDTSWQDLKDHFRKMGEVEHAEVPEGPDGRKKGFGIIKYANFKDASKAIRLLDGMEFQGRTLEVRLDKKRDVETGSGNNDRRSSNNNDDNNNSNSGRQLFVGNLSFQTSWQDLKDHFKTIGPVVNSEVIEGPDGRKKGFGIIKFENAKDAETAIRRLDGVEFQGRSLEVRLDKRESQFSSGGGGGGKRKPRTNNNNDSRGGGGGGGATAAAKDDDDAMEADTGPSLDAPLKCAR